MSQNQPKVTICIPTYNRAWCLPEIITCALTQNTAIPYEILIVDNASTDNTEQLVRAYNHPKIRYERNPSNMGALRNWNRCLDLAQGEYITIWGDDDLVTSNFINEHLAILEADSQISLVYSACQHATANGEIFQEVWPFPYSHIWSSYQELEYMTLYNYMHCSPMFRRSYSKQVGSLNTNEFALTSSDWEYWIRLTGLGKVGYIAKIFYTKRIHSKQSGNQGLNDEKLAQYLNLCVERTLRDMPYIENKFARKLIAHRYNKIAKVQISLAVSALKQQKGKEFRKAVQEAWYWQIKKAGWQLIPYTVLDAVSLLRKYLLGRTMYLFDIS